MSRVSITLLAGIIIVVFSCSSDSSNELVGLWSSDPSGDGKGFYITKGNEKLVLHSNWDNIGEGEFFLNIDGNNISYDITTPIGQIPIRMTFDSKDKTLTVSTINNRIVKMHRFYMKSLDDLVGVWITPNLSVEGVKDSVIVTKDEDKYSFEMIRRHISSYGNNKGEIVRNTYKSTISLQNGTCFNERGRPFAVKYEGDSLTVYSASYYRAK